MANVIQTAIIFPFVLGVVLFLLLSGPVFYHQTVLATDFQVASVLASIENQSLYQEKSIWLDTRNQSYVITAPERMHSLVRSVADSLVIIRGG